MARSKSSDPLVVSIDTLRQSGANISKSLSWERTAQDFVVELLGRDPIKEFSRCKNLVVRFGLAGAIHYYRYGKDMTRSRSTLYYDPRYVEGEYRATDKGDATGLTSMLTATIARAVANGLEKDRQNVSLNKWVVMGIHRGLLNCRILFCHGFGKEAGRMPDLEEKEPDQAHDSAKREPGQVRELEKKNEWNYEFNPPTEQDDLGVIEVGDGGQGQSTDGLGASKTADVNGSSVENGGSGDDEPETNPTANVGDLGAVKNQLPDLRGYALASLGRIV